MMNKFKELKVWQKAIAYVTKIYEASKHFPKDELYGITSQIKRSSVSIPSNIAEGAGRKTKNDYRFTKKSENSILTTLYS